MFAITRTLDTILFYIPHPRAFSRIYFSSLKFNSPLSPGCNDFKRIYTWHSRYAESLERYTRHRVATQMPLSIEKKKKKKLSEEGEGIVSKGTWVVVEERGGGAGWRVNRVIAASFHPRSKGVSLINANSLTARTKYPRHNNCTRRVTLPRHAHPW